MKKFVVGCVWLLFFSQGVLATESVVTVSGEAPDEAPSMAPTKGVAVDRSAWRPMYFSPADYGVSQSPPRLSYDFRSSRSLRIGEIQFAKRDIAASLQDLSGDQNKGDNQPSLHLLFYWPRSLVSEGEITLQLEGGRVIDTFSFSQEKSNKWQSKVKSLSEQTFSSAKGTLPSFGIPLAEIEIPEKHNGAPLKFCVFKRTNISWAEVCSPLYTISPKKQMRRQKRKEALTYVSVNGDFVPFNGDIEVKGDSTTLRAVLISGAQISFHRKFEDASIVDVSTLDKGKQIQILGKGIKPVKAKYLDAHESNIGINFLKFVGIDVEDDPERWWRLVVDSANPTFKLNTIGADDFSQKVIFENLPDDMARIYLSSRNIKSTYSSTPTLIGYVDPSYDVAPFGGGQVSRSSDGEFRWQLLAKHVGANNEGYLLSNQGENSWKLKHEIFRGRFGDVSGRFSSSLDSEGALVPLLEFSTTVWAESLFGWDNYWLSIQRWGVALRYFKALREMGEAGSESAVELSSMTLDLKYRLFPGLWHQDESVGVSLSYQNLEVGEILNGPMAGAGVFWARSLPMIFDNLVSWISFLNYPKWVDAEFIYFPISLENQNSLGTNWNLNFHGKIMWTDAIFGEAGFGFKNYQISSNTGNDISLGMYYGTLGLGINF